SKLAIIVARVPGIDAVGQDVPDRCWLPDLVLARGGGDMGLVQALGNLAATQVLFDQQPIDRADDLGLSRLDHDLRRGIVPFREIAIAIAVIRPWYIFAAPGFLQPLSFFIKNATGLTRFQTLIRHALTIKNATDTILAAPGLIFSTFNAT